MADESGRLVPETVYARAASFSDDGPESVSRLADGLRETLRQLPPDATGKVTVFFSWQVHPDSPAPLVLRDAAPAEPSETLAEFCDRKGPWLAKWSQQLSDQIAAIIPEGGGNVGPVDPRMARYIRSCAAGLVDEIRSAFLILRHAHCPPPAVGPTIVKGG